jgi:pilus assembly protein CpaB
MIVFATLSLKRRPIALLIAFALAGVATVAVGSYVRGVERRAAAGTATVNVLVVKDTIPAFMSVSAALSRGLIEQVQVPERLVAAGAVTSLEAVRDHVATVDLAKGEQLIAARLVTASAAAGILPIPAGKQAMTVALDPSPSVGGFVRPDDRVSIMAKITVTQPGGATTSKVGFVIQNVPVLAVGSQVAVPGRDERTTAAEPEVSAASQTLLTLAVSPVDAERLGYAVLEGELYFTLLSRTKPATASTTGRTADTIFPKR